jgi:membrane associated rhomboid family serine protease
MGLYDRDYARQPVGYEARRMQERLGIGPTTGVVAALCVIVFLLQQVLPVDWVLEWFAMTPRLTLGRGRVWQLLTYVVLHGSLWHLLWNMLFLWWFGQEVERLWGRLDYLGLLLGGGVVAALLHAVLASLQGEAGVPMIGASGAVMAVVILYVCYHPRQPFLFGVPLWGAAMAYLLVDLMMGLRGGTGVAHMAHLGGAAFGFLSWWLDLRLRRLLTRRRRVTGSPARPAPAAGGVNRETRERVDELLAKISREGPGSLTDEEQAFLREASRAYRGS